MTDIGFGLINKRTVIVALFCMVISVSLFKNQLPISTTSVGDIFIGTVLFTGYLLVLRSVYLFPFAVLFSVIKGYRQIYKDINIKYPNPESTSKVRYYFLLTFLKVAQFLWSIISFLRFTPSLLIIFGKWMGYYKPFDYNPRIQNGKLKVEFENYLVPDGELFLKGLVRFIDRVGLICIIFLSTIPRYTPVVKIFGEIGLILSVAIFLMRGDFSFILKDSIGDKDYPVI